MSIVLIIGATILVFMGITGVKAKEVGKRLSALCITTLGATSLSFAQMNVFGLLGGFMQILFRFIGLIFFVVLVFHICKKNQIWKMDDLKGVGRKMPYVFMMVTLLAVMIIGIPSTGAFMGILYSEMGFINGGFGAISIVGMIGNVAGVILPAILIFPIWKNALFPGKGTVVEKEILKPGKGVLAICAIITILLVVFSLMQKPLIKEIGNFIEIIVG